MPHTFKVAQSEIRSSIINTLLVLQMFCGNAAGTIIHVTYTFRADGHLEGEGHIQPLALHKQGDLPVC